MKIRLLHILTLSVVLCSIVPLRVAAAEERTDSLLLKVYFRQDISRLELDYRGNAQMLERFTGEVNRMVNDSSYHIQDIRIRSGASPEGGFNHNRDLSWNRGRVLKDYLQAALLLPDNKFCIEAVGEDWQALREKVQRNSVPDKEKILSILDKYSSWINGHPTSTVGGPKKELMDLNGGKTWFWLLDNIYPDLRSAGNTVVCRYTHAEAPVVFAAAPAYEHRVDTLYIVEKHYYSEAGAAGAGAFAGAAIAQAAPGEKIPRRLQHQIEDRKTVVALRTNLLLPLLNVGVEVPIGNRWSVGLDYYYPWLTRGFDMTHKDCFQLLFLSPEVRYWFGREHGKGSENWSRRLLGHSIGIFGMVGKYDFGRVCKVRGYVKF